MKKLIYLVSLDSDTKRRENLALQFKNEYKNFKHIPAVDGRKLTAKEFYGQLTKYYINNDRLISPSELGCSLSHMKVLEEFLKTDEKYVLILEDDVIGSDEDINKIFQLAEQLDENSLLICGGQEGLSSKKYNLGYKIKGLDLYCVSNVFYPCMYRTCCYLVTRESAKQILKYQKNNLTLADKWDVFFKNSNVNIYFSDVLSHPEDLIKSHIQSERELLSKDNLGAVSLINKTFKKIIRVLVSMFFKVKNNKF